MYIGSYGYFLSLSYIHDMDLIVGLKNLEGYALHNTTNTNIMMSLYT